LCWRAPRTQMWLELMSGAVNLIRIRRMTMAAEEILDFFFSRPDLDGIHGISLN